MFAELEVFGNYRVLDGEIPEKALLKSLLKMSITLCIGTWKINYVNINRAGRWEWETREIQGFLWKGKSGKTVENERKWRKAVIFGQKILFVIG